MPPTVQLFAVRQAPPTLTGASTCVVSAK
jgi:hypothetical protein